MIGVRSSLHIISSFQVPVKSMLEFCKLYFGGCASRKLAPKGPAELSRRGHKGLIVYVSSPRENSDSVQVSKLNFVDMAGCIFNLRLIHFFSFFFLLLLFFISFDNVNRNLFETTFNRL